MGIGRIINGDSVNPTRIPAHAALALSVLFTACGGGGGDTSSAQASTPVLAPAAPARAPAPAPGEGPAGSKNVAIYGARGDGIADDSAAIQAAIDAASSGEVVFLPAPANFYMISETIRLTKPLTLLGAKSLIKSPTAACPTFIKIAANDVQVRGLHLTGPQQSCGYAIDVGSAGKPVSNVRIEDNQIENFYNGMSLIEVDGFRLAGNALSDMNYYGIQGSAVKNGVIDGNTVRGISGANTSGNAYGIVLSRNAASPSNPRSTDIVVSNNNVEDVPVWECYDTHGGQRIHFIDNTCKNAKLGINVAFSGKGQDDPDALAPLECEVRGNTIEKNPADPYRDAIVFAGTMTQIATGSITGNLLIGFGSTGIYTVNANVIQTDNVRKSAGPRQHRQTAARSSGDLRERLAPSPP
jgi:Pectate lyase superfamily protein